MSFPPKPHCLLIDDDPILGPLVQEHLESQDIRCTWSSHGADGMAVFRHTSVDLCLIDVRLPHKNGFELANDMKREKPGVPFIFLTAQGDKEDRIRGFESGAEDYVTKPFSLQELVLRIRVILRRRNVGLDAPTSTDNLSIGAFQFYPERRELIYKGEIKRLSDLESRLLHLFLESPDYIVDRGNALLQLWGDEHDFRDKSLNVFVSKLRHLLQKDERIEILNIHGKGYRLIIR